MTKQVSTRKAGVGAKGTSLRNRGAGLARRVPAAGMISKAVAALRRRWPGAVDATRAGALRTKQAVQAMSDSNLRSLSAGSVGLGAGLFIGGAPRLVAAAGIAPAIVMGATFFTRPGAVAKVRRATRRNGVTALDDSRLDDDGAPVAT